MPFLHPNGFADGVESIGILPRRRLLAFLAKHQRETRAPMRSLAFAFWNTLQEPRGSVETIFLHCDGCRFVCTRTHVDTLFRRFEAKFPQDSYLKAVSLLQKGLLLLPKGPVNGVTSLGYVGVEKRLFDVSCSVQ